MKKETPVLPAQHSNDTINLSIVKPNPVLVDNDHYPNLEPASFHAVSDDTTNAEESSGHDTAKHRHPTTQPVANNSTMIFKQIIEYFNGKRTGQAATLLATHIHMLLETIPMPKVHSVLTALAGAFAEPNADVLYARALFLSRSGQYEDAIVQFQHAHLLYGKTKQQAQAIRCTIEIAHAYINQDKFHVAIRYLADEAKPLLDKSCNMNVALQADYLLQMANLATDIGHLDASTEYAQQALARYINSGDTYGQFRSQLRIARNFMQCGNYEEAHFRLQLIRQYFQIGKLGAASEGQLLNAEIHLRWHQHHFDDALRLTQRYLKLADRERLPYAQLYARILFGNLYRDKHDFWRAEQWYDETERLIDQLEFHFYQPWLDSQRAWLLILQDELEEASSYCVHSLRTTDWGQKMSFQVANAVRNLLQGEMADAEKELNQSLAFYEKSGDLLAGCTIQLYLAYAALKREDFTALLRHLDNGFSYMAKANLGVLPYWWHPQMMAEICFQAIVADIYPTAVREIIVKHIGRHSVPTLTRLLQADDLDVREQAQQLLSSVTGQNSTILAHLEESPAKQILQDHVETGQLRLDGYAQLETELITAKQRRNPNSTLLAVFTLHLRGVKRTAIADRLGCSVENVRNYITHIYRHFDLPSRHFHSREERRQHLVSIARERGYVH